MGLQIWVNGLGMVDSKAVPVLKAVREYDERLYFDRHPVYGDWCIFLRMSHGKEPLPIFNYGSDIPEPHEAIKRLWESDAVRRGEEILDSMNQRNEILRVDSLREADDAEWEAAEVIESFNHRIGETAYHRSLPKKDPKQRASS